MGNPEELACGRGWWVTALSGPVPVGHHHQHSVITYKWDGPLTENLACQCEIIKIKGHSK